MQSDFEACLELFRGMGSEDIIELMTLDEAKRISERKNQNINNNKLLIKYFPNCIVDMIKPTIKLTTNSLYLKRFNLLENYSSDIRGDFDGSLGTFQTILENHPEITIWFGLRNDDDGDDDFVIETELKHILTNYDKYDNIPVQVEIKDGFVNLYLN